MLLSNHDVLVYQDIICDRDLEDVSGMRHDVALKDDGDPCDFKFHIASEKGDLQEVMRLIEEEHLSPLQKDKRGLTAVHYAAIGGHLNMLRYFIEDRGCNAACQGQDRWTPLHYAARNSHLLLVQYLIEKQQVEPFSRNKYGHTALHHACIDGSIDVIRYLAKEMSKYLPLKDVVHDIDHRGMIPMHWAALFGHLDAIKFLITDLLCDLNAADYQNRTFVHTSTRQGHIATHS
jgi:ankyrin repeat protein